MRYFIIAFILTVFLATPAMAGFEGPGGAGEGFRGAQSGAITTVAEANSARDDAYCVLEGQIIEKISGHKDLYIFQDSSGKISVDIDNKRFAGRTVTPQNTVRIHGEVDLDHNGQRDVDVEFLEILN